MGQMIVNNGSTQRAAHVEGTTWTIQALDAQDNWQDVRTMAMTQEQHDKLVAAYDANEARVRPGSIGNIR